MTRDQEIDRLRAMIGQLINANAALMAAGDKMEAALNHCNVRPQVLQEWRAVIHQIKKP